MQTIHETESFKEADAIANEALYAGGQSYSEANPGTNGETFSLAPSTRERDTRPLPPIRISTEKMAGDRSDMRKAVREYIATHLQGRSIQNTDTGWGIGFSSESKSEAVSKARKEPAMRSALHLEEIVGKAVLLGDVPPDASRTQDTERFHYFAIPVEIDGRSAVAWFNVRKHLRGGARTFYEFGLYENAARTSPGLGRGEQGTPANTPTFGPRTTVADFIEKIKGEVPAAVKVDAAPSFSLRQFADSRAVPTDKKARAFEFGNGSLVGPTTFSIRAYHGTPHEVDNFSLDKIGSGEGAQAYGWGLYFAQNQGVAESYRDTLAVNKLQDGSKFNRDDPKQLATDALLRNSNVIARAAAELRARGRSYPVGFRARKIFLEAARHVEKGTYAPYVRSANLYTVELDVEEDELLDWDKPLSEQSEKVLEKLERLGIAHDPKGLRGFDAALLAALDGGNHSLPQQPWDGTGAEVYRKVSRDPGQASLRLRELGIPGIRYLDEGSRSKKDWIVRHPLGGETVFTDEKTARSFLARNPERTLIPPTQTHNYVIFNESKIKITHHNGDAVAPSRIDSGKQEGETFSLRPGDYSSRIAAAFSPFQRSPELRLAIGRVAKERAQIVEVAKQ